MTVGPRPRREQATRRITGAWDGTEPRAVPDLGWRNQAACRDSDPALFFPAPGDMVTVAQAKTICARCPVRTECLEHAIEVGEPNGIWGGTGAPERRRIRARRTAA